MLIDVVQQPGATLDSWTQEKIGSINSRQGASILQLNPTTLGSNPAYKVEYVWEGDKILEMWTVIGDKLYAFSYVGEGEEKYQQNLPAVQSMIDSFRLTTAGSPPVTSLATTTKIPPASPTKPNNDNDKTYCDVPNPSNPCHDRKDGDEETGLYTCMDGSHKSDWRDCTGGGSNNDDDDNDDLPNCNDVEYGTRCDGSEDEDSTLDDETEYEDDGEIEGGEDSGDEEDSGGDEAAADEGSSED